MPEDFYLSSDTVLILVMFVAVLAGLVAIYLPVRSARKHSQSVAEQSLQIQKEGLELNKQWLALYQQAVAHQKEANEILKQIASSLEKKP